MKAKVKTKSGLMKLKKEELVNIILELQKNMVDSSALAPNNIFEILIEKQLYQGNSNGAWLYAITYKVNNKIWKIEINSESYVSQSYIRLYRLGNDEKWNLIHFGNPKRDYEIDISYKSEGAFPKNIFDGIIKDYKDLILKFN